MIDETNPSVLSYVREGVDGNPAVLVTMNFTAQPQTVSLDTKQANITGSTVTTLLTDAPSLQGATSLQNITLPPYASWIGSIK